MSITVVYIKGKRRYYIRDVKGSTLAWFDDLETATLALRLLRGNRMTADETARAMAALAQFDGRNRDGGDTDADSQPE